jgi:signal transduction histidine kinase/response regulator RpfG family c-di-GMP phosphodiesterase
MALSPDGLLHIIRQPRLPPDLNARFRQEVDLSNSRRLKAVTWLLFTSLVGYLFADYFTISRAATPRAHEMWTGILIMRPVALAACGLFLWLFGPLRGVEDLRPRHAWVWKAYVAFFLVYTAVIVGYMFPLKMSIGPVYIFMLGPPAFIAMTTRQAVLHQTLGMAAVAGSLLAFVPESSMVKYHLINAMIISWISFIVAHVTYASAVRDFLNKHLIEKRNAQLEEARKSAEAASQAKSDFLAAISHEIRTPMNAVLGMTEATLHTPLDSRQRDYVETAHESALHLLDVLNDVLDFSRMEARRLRLESRDFDLPEVVLSAMKTVRLQAEQKGLDLDFEIMPGTPRFLRGDPGRLRQVLINLLGNGVKFTDSGHVRVTVGELREVPPGHEADPARPVGLRFCVTDSGRGIPPELGESIFEAFSQADGTSSRTYGGSGLGLAICRDLVRLMGGEISVRSREGRGSEFTFTARFAEGDPEAAIQAAMLGATMNDPARQSMPVTPSRVLLVDDNRTNVKVARLHLERMGMDVAVAESGAEALMLLAEEDFDLVLMDLEMPGMDGHETVRRIRGGQGAGRPVRRPDVPVLAVTAHAMAEMRQRCEKGGMNGLVTKPVSYGELASAMRDILGGEWPPASGALQAGANQAAAPPVLDLGLAAEALGVSRAEVRHLVPNAVAEIRIKLGLAERGVRAATLRETALQAHTLKSVAASIGAEAARRASLRLENAARREDQERSRERLAALQAEVARLEEAATAL